ncbi:hypothetical protein VU08_04845 [Desulfobulbus sp. F5]|nr:hypothetical protein [Desulfobulbus sp. F5]
MYSTVKIIVEQICEIKEEISCKISRFHKFSDSDRNIGRCFLKGKIKHLIVSDTIIFFFDMKDIEESKIERDFHTVPALITVQFILAFIREMFDRGLPLRGYVDYAEYCIFDHFFSGKVLADCHSESNKLDFSGVCMSKKCRDYLANGSNDQNFLHLLQSMIIEIEVPTKNGHEKRWLMNWKHDYTSDNSIQKTDIYDYVRKSFSLHGKTIGKGVDIKIGNTVQVIENQLKY